jgi:hypothetical protein
MKRQLLTLLALMAVTLTFAQFQHNRVYSTFENMKLVKADTFNNGADSSGGFTHYGRFFINDYNTQWKSWSGWSLSNMTDDTTAGFGNQFSAKPGHGISFTSNYMVASGNGAYIKLDSAMEISGAYITNSTYAYLDMRDGSGFSKKFGGATGDDPDYFKLIIKGYNGSEEVSTVDFYLADFRYSDNSKDYILDDWAFVDLDGEYDTNPKVDSIVFRYESTDVGEFGMNTPATFCMDDLNAIPSVIERINYWDDRKNAVWIRDTFYNGSDLAGGISDAYLFFPNSYNSQWDSWSGWSYSGMLDDTTSGFGNQYSCLNDTKETFYVSSGQEVEIRSPYREHSNRGRNPLYKTLPPPPWPLLIKVTNSTYAALDMLNGSGFSKKFGGDDGTDPDYFRLIISYLDDKDSLIRRDSVYLADYRFEESNDDYILNKWKDIKVFNDNKGKSYHKIKFNLESSDVGMFGMNTPATFCLAFDFYTAIVDEVSLESSIDVYPNPVLSVLNVRSEHLIKSLKVFTTSGLLISEMSELSGKTTTINTEWMVPGVYFVQVQTQNGVGTKKFIKQ